MDDHDKARLAKQGIAAAELVEPGKIRERIGDTVSDAAEGAALRGLAAIGRLTGKRSPARAKAASEVDVNRALDALDAASTDGFEARLAAACARKERSEAVEERELANLRKSFPEPARELALLVFNCVDLLEELSEDAEGQPPSPAELVRKEKLLTRIAELIAPRADEAMLSFVSHVVALSRTHREGGGSGSER